MTNLLGSASAGSQQPLQAYVLPVGCIIVGVVLLWSVVAQLRSGATRSGRGGPRGPIRRDDAPGMYWFLFVVRTVLGVVAVGAGLAALSRLQ